MTKIWKFLSILLTMIQLLGIFVFACIYLAGAAIKGSIKLIDTNFGGRYFNNRKK